MIDPAYLQLAGRYLASIVPEHTHVTCPVPELKVPVSVIVPPEMADSVADAVAVMIPLA